MPPKAYRWVDEMREIANGFEAAGWGESSSEEVNDDDDDDGFSNTNETPKKPDDDGTGTVDVEADQKSFEDIIPLLRSTSKIFQGIADVYKFVSEATVLGDEITENRKRGRDVWDVAECLKEGLERGKRVKK